MLKIIGYHRESEIISVTAGRVLFVKHIVGDISPEIATIEPAGKGSKKLTFLKDAVLVVNELSVNFQTVKHLRFAREARQGENPVVPQVKMWAKLRVALHHANVQKVQVPGGLEHAVVYPGEILVADYSMSGSSGWIIRQEDINKYFDMLPPIKDSGEVRSVWINFVGWINTPDECKIEIVGHDPTGEEPPKYWDRPRGEYSWYNHHIFRVEFDTGSLRIKRIVNQTYETDCTEVGYGTFPTKRTAYLDRRLPPALRLES